MYQRYILLHEEGDPSVWISTHRVHRRMEVRIDQINISISLIILKTTKIRSVQDLMIVVTRFGIFFFVVVVHMLFSNVIAHSSSLLL